MSGIIAISNCWGRGSKVRATVLDQVQTKITLTMGFIHGDVLSSTDLSIANQQMISVADLMEDTEVDRKG